MTKNYFKIIPAVYLVLKQDDKILLLRRANTGYQDGMYSLPAGHLDGDEAFTTAMAREAWEEIGVTLQADKLKLVHVQHRRSSEPDLSNERIDFYLQYDGDITEPTNMEPNKCDELKWAGENELPAEVIDHVRKALVGIAKAETASFYGW